MNYLLLTTGDYLLQTDGTSKLLLAAQLIGWDYTSISINSSLVSGTTNLTNFPVLLNDIALGTSSLGTAVWSQSQGNEINTNRFLNDANLQAYYRLESDGTDSSSNGYNLSSQNSPTHATGRFGNGVDLEASSTQAYNYSTNPNNLQITGDLSISCWIKLETINTTQTITRIGAASELESGNVLYSLRVNSSNQLDVYWEYDAGVNEPSITSTKTLISGQWYYIAMTRDVSANTIYFYINGQKETHSYTNNPTGGSAVNFSIGAGVGNLNMFDGLIDDFAIFDRTLTDAEIFEIYRGGADLRFSTDDQGANQLNYEVVNWDTTSEKGEVWVKFDTLQATTNTEFYMWYNNALATTTSNATAVWSENYQAVYHLENGGDFATDSTYNDYTVTSVNNPLETTGKIGSAVYFDNSGSQYMSISDGSATNLEISTSQSWSALVNLQSLPSSYGYRVMNKGKLSNPNNRAELIVDQIEAGKIIYQINSENLKSTQTLGTGEWYHIAGVYDAATPSLSVYVNGSVTTGTIASTAHLDSNADFLIGASSFGSSDTPAQFFDGIIDDVFVTNDAKSTEWIQTYYNNTFDPGNFFIFSIDYTRAISDNLSITDIIYRESNFFRQETNVINLTDDVVRTHNVISTVAQDTIGITDSIDLISLLVITVAQDTVGITDDVIRQAEFSRQNINTVTATDIIDRTADYNRDLSNTLTLTDIILGTRVLGVTITDTINVTDTTTYKKISNQVENPIIKFMQIDEIKPTIYNITNG